MNKKDCYNQGYNTGHDIAKSNIHDYDLSSEEGHDKFISEMCEHESDVYRQYSPFEFFAHDINSYGERSEGLWESYDNGVYNGILAAIKDKGG